MQLFIHRFTFYLILRFDIIFIFVSLLQDLDDIYANTYIPGTLTKHKLETLGTSDAVKESRQNYLTNQKKEKGKYTHANFKLYSVLYIACEKEIYFSFLFILEKFMIKKRNKKVYSYSLHVFCMYICLHNNHFTLNCHKFTFRNILRVLHLH